MSQQGLSKRTLRFELPDGEPQGPFQETLRGQKRVVISTRNEEKSSATCNWNLSTAEDFSLRSRDSFSFAQRTFPTDALSK